MTGTLAEGRSQVEEGTPMFLELDAVSKSFGGHRAVSGLSLGVERGELMCLLGSSGCGKTTVLNMVGGFLAPDEGRILLDGADITRLGPEERPVATVFQSYALFPHMDVEHNVAYGLKFRGVRGQAARGRVARYLELVGLEEYARARVQDLSGGQQQRVALARCLVIEPKVCLLDEPFCNLDAKLRVRMRGELKAIQRATGTTMLFVTHDQEEALALGDRMAVIHDGRLQQVGAPLEVFRSPANDFVRDFLGVDELVWRDGGLFKRLA